MPWHGTVSILDNVRVARDTYRLRIGCPEIASAIVPGQFLMLRLTGFDDPLIGRAFALYDTVQSGLPGTGLELADGAGRPIALDVVYYAAGKLTARLARFVPGQQVDVWGPLGNGFPPRAADHLLMVAGGIGQTPFLALAQECLGRRTYGRPPRPVPRIPRVTLCYGARTADLLAGVDDFERLGVEVRISTDDGTAGRHGLVTALVEQVLAESGGPSKNSALAGMRIVCCGPERMMAAVAGLAQNAGVRCELSLETPMACGLGICFSCVAKIRGRDGEVDYRRTCVEGPVFEANEVVF